MHDVTPATTSVIRLAKQEDRLESLTPRMIRREVEKILGLEEETLDSKPYKDAVKKAANAAMEEKESAEEKQVRGAKRASDAVGTEVKTAKKPKTKVVKKPDISDVSGAEFKKTSTSKRAKVFKSADTIETSDEEGEPSVSTKSLEKGKESPKKRSKVLDAAPASSSPPALKPKPQSTSKGPKSDTAPGPSKLIPSTTGANTDDDNKSDSEMSVLIDATPINKKAKKAPLKAKKETEPTKGKKIKKATSGLSKDEETVKRLKSYVYGCGVRKVWTKEFQNLEKSSQQIKRLKEMLTELGMEGRPTIEKAKAIKAKRDFAQELEDVQSFEQTISKQSSRTRAKGGKDRESAEPDAKVESGSGGEFSDQAPAKHRNAARRSIMAFLGDDSEDE